MADVPHVTIVVPVHGRSLLTKNVIERLLRSPRQPEIVVVNDASPDDTAAVLATFGDRIEIVELDRNRGFAGACNAGARSAAAGEFLVFMNNDLIPTEGWLDELLAYAAEHERAAIVGSKLLFPNDSVQHAGVVVCQDLYPRHVYAGFPAGHPAVCRSRRFQIVTGGCMLVRRAVFESLGGFDEAYVNGYEDVDLCLRAGEAGHEVHYCHSSVLYHLESMSRQVSPSTQANRRRYLERWRAKLEPDELATYAADGLLEISYRPTYPYRFRLSPLLGTIDEEHRAQTVDRLLDERADQVLRLLRETIRLQVRLGELPELSGEVVGGMPEA